MRLIWLIKLANLEKFEEHLLQHLPKSEVVQNQQLNPEAQYDEYHACRRRIRIHHPQILPQYHGTDVSFHWSHAKKAQIERAGNLVMELSVWLSAGYHRYVINRKVELPVSPQIP